MRVDPALVKALIQATVETLKIQCSSEFKAGVPFEAANSQESTSEISNANIVAVVALMGKKSNGVVAVFFPEKTFLEVMGGMFGEHYDSISEELQDGAGELLNIIFAKVRKTLNEQGYSLVEAIPSIVVGEQLRMRSLKTKSSVVLPFSGKRGEFRIQVSLKDDASQELKAA